MEKKLLANLEGQSWLRRAKLNQTVNYLLTLLCRGHRDRWLWHRRYQCRSSAIYIKNRRLVASTFTNSARFFSVWLVRYFFYSLPLVFSVAFAFFAVHWNRDSRVGGTGDFRLIRRNTFNERLIFNIIRWYVLFYIVCAWPSDSTLLRYKSDYHRHHQHHFRILISFVYRKSNSHK